MNNGNVMFVVCRPCEQAEQADFGVKIAGRTRIGFYDPMVPPKQLAAWFMKHAKCGGRTNPDHFMLAHQFERNHDQKALEAVVNTALVQ